MADEDSVSQTFENIREWNEFGARLSAMAGEVKEEIKGAPLYVTEDGKYHVHPILWRKLNEPGNEGPLEFLRYMQRNGLGIE